MCKTGRIADGSWLGRSSPASARCPMKPGSLDASWPMTSSRRIAIALGPTRWAGMRRGPYDPREGESSSLSCARTRATSVNFASEFRPIRSDRRWAARRATICWNHGTPRARILSTTSESRLLRVSTSPRRAFRATAPSFSRAGTGASRRRPRVPRAAAPARGTDLVPTEYSRLASGRPSW